MRKLSRHLTLCIGSYALALLLVSAGAAVWREGVHAELAQSFASDLKAVGLISDIRAAFRRAEHPDSQINEGAGAIIDSKVMELKALPMSSEERVLLGRLAQPQDRRKRDLYIKDLRALKQINLRQLETKRRAVRRASLVTFLAMALFVILSSWGLGVLISRTLVRPITRLVGSLEKLDVAQDWHPDNERSGIWEIDTLKETVAQAGVRLRLQYEKLEHLDAMRERLISMASHEYGNFMTSVLTGLSLLEGNDLPPERHKKIFGVVQANARILISLGEDFLNLARSKLGVIELDMQTVDMAKIARRFIGLSELRSSARGIHITEDIAPNLPQVRGHGPTLAFVINNLIGNAIKYAQDGGNVEIRVAASADFVEFSVKDDGGGMDQETIQRVLRGGYRSREARTSVFGFGVGLSLAREILEAHGTAIDVESRIGQGSCFRFRLPALKAPVSLSVDEKPPVLL